MIVHFHEDVDNYLVELVEILYEKEYFGFKESAINYVQELVYEIRDTIFRKHKKAAPRFFARYGYGEVVFYVKYQRNRNTQWYVFFTFDDDDNYYVNYIANNHTISQYL